MSDPAHALTADRMEVLILIATGGKRRDDRPPVRIWPGRLAWLVREGYVLQPDPLPPTDAKIKPRPLPVLTQKGLDAVAEYQRRSAQRRTV